MYAQLDLMAKGFLYYPTWLRLPLLRRGEPFDLMVDLRIYSTESFRSNDSWPRQPGAGFRSMFAMLNNLLRNGPSLASSPRIPESSREVDTTQEPYMIDTLLIQVSFHDPYTPATWPNTADEIVHHLYRLASTALPWPYIKHVRVGIEFGETAEEVEVEWRMQRAAKQIQLDEWDEHCSYFERP